MLKECDAREVVVHEDVEGEPGVGKLLDQVRDHTTCSSETFHGGNIGRLDPGRWEEGVGVSLHHKEKGF